MFYSVFDVFDLIFTRVYHVLYFFLRLICKTVEFVLQTFELSLIFHPAKYVTNNYTFGESIIGTLTVTPVAIELTAASA